MEPALAYFSIRSGRMPSEANMTTLSTGRPSPSFLAMAEPAPSVMTNTSAATPQKEPAPRKRRPRFILSSSLSLPDDNAVLRRT